MKETVFDQALLDRMGASARVYRAGSTTQVSDTVTSRRLFDEAIGFREHPERHGTFSAVIIEEHDIGEYPQWPMILDEALRLLSREASGLFCIRFRNSQVLSVFAFAGYLRRRRDFAFELINQPQLAQGFLGFVIRCKRLDEAPSLSSFEFSLITNGSRPEAIERFVKAVHCLDGNNDIDWSIAICGPRGFEEQYQRQFEGYRADRVRFIDEPDEHREHGWISRKKNLLVQTSNAENLLIAHDRFSPDARFLHQMKEYGADFSVLAPAQTDARGERIGDWVSMESLWTWAPQRLLPYGAYEPGLYVNGGVIIAKRQVLLDCPWNDLLFWNQAEDVELTREMMHQGITPRIARNVQVHTPAPRDSYIYNFRRISLPGIPDCKDRVFEPDRLLNLCGRERHDLARDGVIFYADTWVSGDAGLRLCQSVGEIALPYDAFGFPTRFHFDLGEDTDVSRIKISANGDELNLSWTRAEASWHGSAILAEVRRPLVDQIVLWFENAENLSLRNIATEKLATKFAYPIIVRQGADTPKWLLGGGWSDLEPDFIWSDGERAELWLPVPPEYVLGSFQLDLRLWGFTTPSTGPQLVDVYLADKHLGRLTITADVGVHSVTIPAGAIEGRGYVKFTLKIDRPLTPFSLGLSQDRRRLGVALSAVELKPAQCTATTNGGPMRRVWRKIARFLG